MRAAIYVRVSTADGRQEVENQLAELRKFADTRGWEGVVEYIDHESESRTEPNGARLRRRRSGRPVGRPRISIDAERILKLRDERRLSWPEIGRQVHAGATTVRRAYKDAKTAGDAHAEG
jgi:DNA invertase Pin-like site-specific DNA recombinase